MRSGLTMAADFVLTGIGNRHNAGVGLDGAEREVFRADTGFGQCIKQRGFADIGQGPQFRS